MTNGDVDFAAPARSHDRDAASTAAAALQGSCAGRARCSACLKKPSGLRSGDAPADRVEAR